MPAPVAVRRGREPLAYGRPRRKADVSSRHTRYTRGTFGGIAMRLAVTLAALLFAAPARFVAGAAAIVLPAQPPAPAKDDYPHVVIKNDKLKFTLYETDAKKGFYRGTRFDHAGVFGNVEFA